VQVSGPDEVSHNWEEIKRQEREAHGQRERSLLDGVPKSMPALAQTYAYACRAKGVGFEWPDMESVVAKVHEEWAELEAAETEEEVAAEVGDLLAAVVNLARWRGVEPESALRESNLRFARRFRHIEAEARRRGIPLEQLGMEEMERLWEEAKSSE
jgi:MazG family protein